MDSKQIVNAELIKANFISYSEQHRKAIAVLKLADGKKSYSEIASVLKMHPTDVSSLLKETERLGLTLKINGLYKKRPGIFKYRPKLKKQNIINLNLHSPIDKNNKKRTGLKIGHITSIGVNLNNSGEMSEAYKWLYITENTLRDLVRRVLNHESDWWAKRVNSRIKDAVEKAKQKYPYHAAKRKDELEYTHLGQLKEIIISTDNWELFLPYLKEKDKNSFIATVDKAIPSRNSIAHCTPLSKYDLKVINVRFNDILIMLQ